MPSPLHVSSPALSNTQLVAVDVNLFFETVLFTHSVRRVSHPLAAALTFSANAASLSLEAALCGSLPIFTDG